MSTYRGRIRPTNALRGEPASSLSRAQKCTLRQSDLPVDVLSRFTADLDVYSIDAAFLTVPRRDFGEFLGSPDGAALLHGSWLWLAILLAFFLFNTVLGEELLFRGYLLPRMIGVFGSKDWVANGVVFAAYHLHVPWVIPIALLDTLLLSLPSRRYQSAWIGIITHSSQSVFLFTLVLMLFLTSPR